MVDATAPADPCAKAAADQMQDIVRSIIWAVNNRHFESNTSIKGTTDSDNSIWNCFADDFNAEPEYISSALSKMGDQHPLPLKLSEGSAKVSVVGPQRIQEVFQRIIEAFPSYEMRAGDISTTVHEKARWAISYVSMETIGMPEGVVRSSLGVFEWKKIGDKWLLSKYEGMTGISPE